MRLGQRENATTSLGAHPLICDRLVLTPSEILPGIKHLEPDVEDLVTIPLGRLDLRMVLALVEVVQQLDQCVAGPITGRRVSWLMDSPAEDRGQCQAVPTSPLQNLEFKCRGSRHYEPWGAVHRALL